MRAGRVEGRHDYGAIGNVTILASGVRQPLQGRRALHAVLHSALDQAMRWNLVAATLSMPLSSPARCDESSTP